MPLKVSAIGLWPAVERVERNVNQRNLPRKSQLDWHHVMVAIRRMIVVASGRRAGVVMTSVDYERQTAHFTGIVQGVGFRYTAQRMARQFDVAGYVRNLPDGRVLLVAEGTTSQLDQLFNQIQVAMDRYIQRIEVSHDECTDEFDGFEIRY